jgi:phage regulator Rha-like protein
MSTDTMTQREKNLIGEAFALANGIFADSADVVAVCEAWQAQHDDVLRTIQDYRNLCATLMNPRVHRNLTPKEREAFAEVTEIAANILNMPAFFAPVWLSAMGFMPAEEAA